MGGQLLPAADSRKTAPRYLFLNTPTLIPTGFRQSVRNNLVPINVQISKICNSDISKLQKNEEEKRKDYHFKVSKSRSYLHRLGGTAVPLLAMKELRLHCLLL